jgi:hypothetical protein
MPVRLLSLGRCSCVRAAEVGQVFTRTAASAGTALLTAVKLERRFGSNSLSCSGSRSGVELQQRGCHWLRQRSNSSEFQRDGQAMHPGAAELIAVISASARTQQAVWASVHCCPAASGLVLLPLHKRRPLIRSSAQHRALQQHTRQSSKILDGGTDTVTVCCRPRECSRVYAAVSVHQAVRVALARLSSNCSSSSKRQLS